MESCPPRHFVFLIVLRNHQQTHKKLKYTLSCASRQTMFDDLALKQTDRNPLLNCHT